MGGAERSLIGLALAWRRRRPDVEIDIVTHADHGVFVDALTAVGLDSLLIVPSDGWLLPQPPEEGEDAYRLIRLDNAAVMTLIEQFSALGTDLVVTNSSVTPWAAIAAAMLGIPHVWIVREFGDLDHGLIFLEGKRETYEDIAFLSDRIFANSDAVRAHLLGFLPDASIGVMVPPVDPTQVENAAQTPSGPFVDIDARTRFDRDHGLRLAMVGNLAPAKGQLLAVRALAVLVASGHDVVLTLVGSDEDRAYSAEVRTAAQQAGVEDRLRVLGHRENPYPEFAAADVVIVASRSEAFGRVTVEGMLLGKPVVATDAAGTSDIVQDGVTGFLVAPDDPNALGAAIARYLAEPGLIAEHGSNGRARAMELIRHNTADDAVEELIELVESGHRRRRLPHLLNGLLAITDHVDAMNAKWDAMRYDELVHLVRTAEHERDEEIAALESEVSQLSQLTPRKIVWDAMAQRRVIGFPLRVSARIRGTFRSSEKSGVPPTDHDS